MSHRYLIIVAKFQVDNIIWKFSKKNWVPW